MSGEGIQPAMMLASALFSLGLLGVLARRNLLFILMGLELMLNAAGLAFIAAGRQWGQPDGQIMFLFILVLGAAEVSVGLALLLRIQHRFRTLDVQAIRRMGG